MARTQVIAHWAPKGGNSSGEYEDSWRVGEPAAGEPLRVAVADGATESLLAGRWARLLTAALVEAEPEVTTSAEAFARAVAAAARQWPGEIEEYVSGRETAANPLRWYERPGLERGAYATGLVVGVAPGGTWNAAAVGDTCLFHVRENRLLTAFPLAEARKFGDAPPLLGSPDTDPAAIVPMVALSQGSVAAGDRLYACTGALAAWFLGEYERGGRPWEVMDAISGPFFETWLEEIRENDQIRGDDVTLLRVEAAEGEP